MCKTKFCIASLEKNNMHVFVTGDALVSCFQECQCIQSCIEVLLCVVEEKFSLCMLSYFIFYYIKKVSLYTS